MEFPTYADYTSLTLEDTKVTYLEKSINVDHHHHQWRSQSGGWGAGSPLAELFATLKKFPAFRNTA